MDETDDLIERAWRSAEEARRVVAETRRLVGASREIQRWTAQVQGRVAGETGKLFSFNRFSNRLLAILPATDFERLAPHLRAVAFKQKGILYSVKSHIEHIYFPISGVLSATIGMQDGSRIEIASIGNEGMAGLPVIVGNTESPYDVSVQIPGHGLSLDIARFQSEYNRGGLLRDILIGYHRACAVQNAYQIACNGLHSVSKRCCRQLLSIQDHIGADILPITHESLAYSLGVRRASVTAELRSLQADGAVDMKRGQIRILHRPKLKSLACECYQAVSQEYVRLFQSMGIDDLRALQLLHASADLLPKQV